MNVNAVISAHDPILGGLEAVRRNWRWVLASGIAFLGLGTMAFGYSVLVMLASVFVLGWVLVFGGIFQAIHAFKIFQWSGLPPGTDAGDSLYGRWVGDGDASRNGGLVGDALAWGILSGRRAFQHFCRQHASSPWSWLVALEWSRPPSFGHSDLAVV